MRAGKHTAKAFAEALSKAEEQLVPWTKDNPWTESDPPYVKLRLSEIEVRPELFQPREFLYGAREVDKAHVRKLEGRMRYKGELEPIVVIKLGKSWVCTDGHHRLAAYQKRAWKKQLKCQWFTGSVREATDASVSNNDVVKLELRPEDRYENAWKRELLNDPYWSKSRLVSICGVGERTVSEMRRAKKAYQGNDEFSIRFRAALKETCGTFEELSELSWWKVKQVLNGTEERAYDLEAEALKLAHYLRNRIQGRLSENPKVTARAIDIYDPELPKRLARALWDLNENADDNTDAQPWAEIPETTLRFELIHAEGRQRNIKAEIERREQEAQEAQEELERDPF
jgi:ParB/Sulfiredoxin domain